MSDNKNKNGGMKKMKTYYSVTYAVWGADTPRMAWFDNKKEAEQFAAHDYRNDPVVRNCSKPDTIARYSELVARTKQELFL